MSDNYIHLGDFEKFVRSKFKNIVEGEGLTIPRQIVGYTLDEIFNEDAVLTPAEADADGCMDVGDCKWVYGFCQKCTYFKPRTA